MTYIESYMACENLSELQNAVAIDVLYAAIFDRDKLYEIEKAIKTTIKNKGWEDK